MTNYQVLNTQAHKNLTVRTDYSTGFGDKVSNVTTFPTEFGNVQNEYPILFRKHPETGEFGAFVMLGFSSGENLYLTDKGWDADYVPAAIARGPFLIGFQNQESQGKSAQEPIINIDMDSPRVTMEGGERLFDDEGNQTPYFNNIQKILAGIHKGVEYSKLMFKEYLELNLIEPVTIDVEFVNGEKVKIDECYTIHEERLKDLDGANLEKLSKSGLLQAAYIVIASINNLKRLIHKKNKQITQQS